MGQCCWAWGSVAKFVSGAVGDSATHPRQQKRDKDQDRNEEAYGGKACGRGRYRLVLLWTQFVSTGPLTWGVLGSPVMSLISP